MTTYLNQHGISGGNKHIEVTIPMAFTSKRKPGELVICCDFGPLVDELHRISEREPQRLDVTWAGLKSCTINAFGCK